MEIVWPGALSNVTVAFLTKLGGEQKS